MPAVINLVVQAVVLRGNCVGKMIFVVVERIMV
jgi:hypothetical protein